MKEERLIIKNFGPIKSIDIPIRKINVLIGDQGTGKSTVAKVLAFIKNISFIIYPTTENSFSFFFLDGYKKNDSEIFFESAEYSVSYTSENGFVVDYSESLKKLINVYRNEANNIGKTPNSNQVLLHDIINNITKITGLSSYIPTERLRIFNSKTNVVNQSNNYLNTFHQDYSSYKNIYSNFDIPFLDLKYSHQNNKELFKKGNLELPVIESASGFQSILPIILFSKQYLPEGFGTGYFIVEEPELSLFPKTQRDLINYLVGKIYPLNDYMFFTTHSPYILSSLNNLLYAFKVGQINEEDTNRVVDKKHWVNPSDLSAYLLNEKGEAEDLMDLELQQIAVERIDEISQTINEEYDKLSDIKWAKK